MVPIITVVGSICLDMAIRIPHLPRVGETVLGTELATPVGGKGFNQALQAHRLGAKVNFFARLGDDPYGHLVVDELEREEFPVRGIRMIKNEKTALGLIFVAPDGTNMIAGFSGANMNFSLDDIDQNIYDALQIATHLILQLEIPDDVNLAVLRLARELSVRTVMNFAPYRDVPSEIIDLVDILIFNEVEASQFFKEKIETADDILKIKKSPLYKWQKVYIVTLGANGAAMIAPEGEYVSKGIEVNSVDSTGAGDSFVGSYVYFISNGKGYAESLDLANIVASESTTILGAMPSLPNWDRVDEVFREKGISFKKSLDLSMELED